MDFELLSKINGKPGALQGRQRGRVVTFKVDRGFGFLQPDGGGDDLFFHVADARADFFGVGDLVEYSLGTDRRNGRPKAISVSVVE